jgi:hypothetical protein
LVMSDAAHTSLSDFAIILEIRSERPFSRVQLRTT